MYCFIIQNTKLTYSFWHFEMSGQMTKTIGGKRDIFFCMFDEDDGDYYYYYYYVSIVSF